MSDDCAVGVWLGWGKFFAADLVLCFRWGLILVIEELAALESWSDAQAERAAYEMACGPVGDILPNAHHFLERLDAARAADFANQMFDRQRRRPTSCDDHVGIFRTADVGLFLPWGPRLSPDDVQRILFELAELIDNVADSEGWSFDHRADVMRRAKRGPLADLLPNLAYFRERMGEIFAERDARRLIASWMQRRGAAR
ncbi:hypothetical protein WJ41_05070 [Burkholderia ubonensis]|uniref:hypothetical protein n=1 Tax=Burkholderia ubonensis TaxID=101571 RepID=UPI0007592816|nr:hypothetical protein [Burkholderia ubonensis]KVH77576.1 hypothetical protein WJ41_05070 [Burkholderia ubonensis]KVU11046.1 hypothetical protein WK61_01660 [Burkholderia ubonensis]